jgi:hypothetical protein
LAIALDRPDDEEEIYHARGDELSAARPLLTGDILEEVELPGQGLKTTMIVSHPCTMRRGAVLASTLMCAPVDPFQQLSPQQWESGFVRIFPLSKFADDDHRAVHLDKLVSVASEDINIDSRIACLEHSGIYLLQQRLIHSLARCKVGLSTIRMSMEHVLAEAELQEDWVEELCDPDEVAARQASIQDFDDYLTDEGLRLNLEDPNKRAQVISKVSREIADRRANLLT